VKIYTDEDLKWDNPPSADCLSIHLAQLTFGLSVTLPLKHINSTPEACEFKSSMV
jgi:hypothetical protein